MDKLILSTIFCITNNYKRYVSTINGVDDFARTNGVTRMLISFICESKEDVYQKTIEKTFGFSRSTASNIITQMENGGLVVREKVNEDQRLRKLSLTDKSIIIYNKIREEKSNYEKIITKDFSKEELNQLNYLLNKLKNAVGKE